MNTFDALYGPAAPDLGWIPAPRYLLRRDRIRRLIAGVQPGRLLGMRLQRLFLGSDLGNGYLTLAVGR